MESGEPLITTHREISVHRGRKEDDSPEHDGISLTE